MERVFTENGDERRQYYDDLVTLKSRLFPLENLLYEISTHGIINLKFGSINIVRLRIQVDWIVSYTTKDKIEILMMLYEDNFQKKN
ncbi:hypothetical protein RhiirA4_490553 [Rhizophagus irregularis]|uniref:Uncharacterized protein n=1 Tax=Rhizophagus irregularis TaxID=588596 RepID=A0A2I1HVU5_9GLOM|nr:hypothetical protein RhiirA4_490553 [Rhizophagus irregularis]